MTMGFTPPPHAPLISLITSSLQYEPFTHTPLKHTLFTYIANIHVYLKLDQVAVQDLGLG